MGGGAEEGGRSRGGDVFLLVYSSQGFIQYCVLI